MEKTQVYQQTILQIKSLIEGLDNKVGALANVTAALKEAFDHYFWVGFYIARNKELELEPCQAVRLL